MLYKVTKMNCYFDKGRLYTFINGLISLTLTIMQTIVEIHSGIKELTFIKTSFWRYISC